MWGTDHISPLNHLHKRRGQTTKLELRRTCHDQVCDVSIFEATTQSSKSEAEEEEEIQFMAEVVEVVVEAVVGVMVVMVVIVVVRAVVVLIKMLTFFLQDQNGGEPRKQ